MFKHLFKKQPNEEPEEVTQAKEDSVKTTVLMLALQDIVDKFDVNLNTIKKETKVIYNNRPPKITKAILETTDNHNITLEIYSGNNFKEHSRDVSITVDNHEAIDMHYAKVASYLSACGATEKQPQVNDYVVIGGYRVDARHVQEFIVEHML